MTADENIINQFNALLEQGSMPRSSCSGGFLRKIQPLVDAGVVVEERSGAGRRMVVHDFRSLENFKRLYYPESIVPEGMSTRVAGVARFRESKALENDTPEIITLRAFSEGALTRNGEPTEALDLTRKHGVFSFLSDEGHAYKINGSCALVENPAVFTRFESLGVWCDIVLLGRGKVSNRLIDWISTMHAGFKLVHFPDYDPVGLMDFERLRKALGSRVQLYLPSDLDRRFQRYSNPNLLKIDKNRRMLALLRDTGVPETRRVLELIDRHNAVLEQEALLLSLE